MLMMGDMRIQLVKIKRGVVRYDTTGCFCPVVGGGRSGFYRGAGWWRWGCLAADDLRQTHTAAAAFARGDVVAGDEGGFYLIISGLVPAECGAEGLVS